MEQKKIPEEIEFLNLLYRTCIEIGKLTIFYKLIGSCRKQDYIRNKKHLKRDVFEKKKKTGFVSLKWLFPFFFFTKFKNAAGQNECIYDVHQNDMKKLLTTLNTKKLL